MGNLKKALSQTAEVTANMTKPDAPVIETIVVPVPFKTGTEMEGGKLLTYGSVIFHGWSHPSVKAGGNALWWNTGGRSRDGDTPSGQIEPCRSGSGACAAYGYTDQPRGRKVYAYQAGDITIGLSQQELDALDAAGPVLRDLRAMCVKHGEGSLTR